MAYVAAAALWKVRQSALHEEMLIPLAALVFVSSALVTGGLLLGRAWRTRASPVRGAAPALLAIFLPIVAAIVLLSFQEPTWWPRWLDSEFAAVVAIFTGGILGVFLLLSSQVDGRSGRAGRWVLFAWSVIVLVGGTGSVLFLE